MIFLVVEVVVVAVLIEVVVEAVLITEEEESIKSPPGGFSPRYKFSPKSKNNLSTSCAQINISKTCSSQEFHPFWIIRHQQSRNKNPPMSCV